MEWHELSVIKSQLNGMRVWLEQVDDLEELKRLMKGAVVEIEEALGRLESKLQRGSIGVNVEVKFE